MRETFSFLNARACGWNVESSFAVENQMCTDGLDAVFAGAVPDSPARRFQAIRSIGWHTRLSETEKDKDRDTIRDIPRFLAAGGYEVIRP
jgi:hypothetical protein